MLPKVYFTKYLDMVNDSKIIIDWYRHHEGHTWRGFTASILIFHYTRSVTIVWRDIKSYEESHTGEY